MSFDSAPGSGSINGSAQEKVSVSPQEMLDVFLKLDDSREEKKIEIAYLKQLAKGVDSLKLSKELYPDWSQEDFVKLIKGLDNSNFYDEISNEIKENKELDYPKQREAIMSGPRPSAENILEKAKKMISDRVKYILPGNNQERIKEKLEDPLGIRLEGDSLYDAMRTYDNWSKGEYPEDDPVPVYQGYHLEDYAALRDALISEYKIAIKNFLEEKSEV
jgi:hypothetical protein